MCKVGVWGMAAALALGLAARGYADDEDEQPPKKPAKSWWSKMWGGGDKPPAGDEEEQEEKKDEAARKKEAEAARLREQKRKEEVARAYEDFLRREKALLKIKEYAQSAKDPEAVYRKADELYERAWEIYRRKAGNLEPRPGPRRGTHEGIE